LHPRVAEAPRRRVRFAQRPVRIANHEGRRRAARLVTLERWLPKDAGDRGEAPRSELGWQKESSPTAPVNGGSTGKPASASGARVLARAIDKRRIAWIGDRRVVRVVRQCRIAGIALRSFGERRITAIVDARVPGERPSRPGYRRKRYRRRVHRSPSVFAASSASTPLRAAVARVYPRPPSSVASPGIARIDVRLVLRRTGTTAHHEHTRQNESQRSQWTHTSQIIGKPMGSTNEATGPDFKAGVDAETLADGRNTAWPSGWRSGASRAAAGAEVFAIGANWHALRGGRSPKGLWMETPFAARGITPVSMCGPVRRRPPP